MELGTRGIRSSGRGSGSIEITLPSRLRRLSGLSCRVSWHDAPTPHLRLTPDLGPALAALARFQQLLSQALGWPAGASPPPDIRLAATNQAGLLWDDVMALSRPAPHEALVISRILAASAHPHGPEGFAPALAFLATGAVPGAEHRADCAIVAAAFSTRAAAPLDGFGEALWQAMPRQARALTALHRALAADPARLEQLRRAARAGGRIDLRGLPQ